MPLVIRLIAMIMARAKTMGWLQWAGVGWLAEKIYNGDLKGDVYNAITAEVAERTGMELNPDDPLSDASLSNAVSERFGMPIRSFRDQQMIREDLENYAARVVSEKSGYEVRSVTNIDILKADLIRIAAAELSGRLGIPAGVIDGDGGEFNAEAVKGRLLEWAKAQLLTVIEQEGAEIMEGFLMSANMQAVVTQVNDALRNGGSDVVLSERALAVSITSQLAAKAVTSFMKTTTRNVKRERRIEQLRLAQQRFRARHGNRMQYVPLGYVNHPYPEGGEPGEA